MNIDGIQNGYVIDHIHAGRGMMVYRYLGLDKLSDCSVAIIKNAKSRRMGRKDILKIAELSDVELDILGYIDPEVNPRCITPTAQEREPVVVLAEREKGTYRCLYCEGAHKNEEKPEF